MAGTHAAAGVLSVSPVEFFDDIAPFDDLAEGSETCFAIVASGIVTEIDVDLCGARVRAGVGKGDVAKSVVLLQRVVGDGDVALLLRNFRIAVDAELYPATRDDPEEPRVVVVPSPDEFVEAVGPVRRPVAMSFDDEGAGRSFELHSEDGGCCVIPEGKCKHETEQINHAVQYLSLPFELRLDHVFGGVRFRRTDLSFRISDRLNPRKRIENKRIVSMKSIFVDNRI
jgi:hypothetical protein